MATDNDTTLQAVSTPASLLPTLVVIAIFAVAGMTVAIAVERHAAKREHAAYERLCLLGATGDDWVSLREIVTWRPPIVQVEIPATIPSDVAFELLKDLYNLEALSLSYATITPEQLDLINELPIDSLHFSGHFPSDDDVMRLSCLRGLRFLNLPDTNLSADAQKQLRSVLPACKITFD